MSNTGDLNNLEKKLESLVPRQASERVKRRLFGERADYPARRHDFRLAACLVPTACCILLMGMHLGAWRQDGEETILMRGNSNELAGLTSNLLASCSTGALGGRENLWREVTFEWTKGGNSASTTGPFPVGKTNVQKL